MNDSTLLTLILGPFGAPVLAPVMLYAVVRAGAGAMITTTDFSSSGASFLESTGVILL